MRARIHIAEEQGCSPHLWCLLNVIRAAFLSFELGLCCMFWHPRNCSVVLTTLRRRFLKALEEAKMISVGASSFILHELSTRDISDVVDRR